MYSTPSTSSSSVSSTERNDTGSTSKDNDLSIKQINQKKTERSEVHITICPNYKAKYRATETTPLLPDNKYIISTPETREARRLANAASQQEALTNNIEVQDESNMRQTRSRWRSILKGCTVFAFYILGFGSGVAATFIGKYISEQLEAKVIK